MNKDEFSIAIIKKHNETKEDYTDILLEIMNKEDTEVSYDNIKKFLTDDLKQRLEEECKDKKMIKEKFYKKGLYKLTELM